jgi:hypothetical protein
MAYRNNHVVSSCYLAEWAGEDGRLCVVAPPQIESTFAKPHSIGHRKDLWGRDARVRRAVEEALGRVETDIARVLRGLTSLWPLEQGTTDWFALAYLVAIHVLRTPYARRRMVALQEPALKRQLPRLRDWDHAAVDRFLHVVTSDAWHTQIFSEQLPQVATLIASMHWTLVEFQDEVLATSDQPVTVIPSTDERPRAPHPPLPATGLADCQEIRMALDPSHALVLTWLNEPDDGLRLPGNDWVAAELNHAVIGQADAQWFHHPVRRPTTLIPPLLDIRVAGPVGPQLFPDHSPNDLVHSRRRVDTFRNLKRMIENPVPGELRVAAVGRAA